MVNQENRKNDGDIDEAHLMSIMAGDTKKVVAPVVPDKGPDLPQQKNLPRDKPKVRKVLEGSYGNHFLRTHTMTRRGEKSIYIRPEYHERLSRIVQVIGEDQIPLYAYLDNILEHHFEMFEKAITQDFNDKYKPIF